MSNNNFTPLNSIDLENGLKANNIINSNETHETHETNKTLETQDTKFLTVIKPHKNSGTTTSTGCLTNCCLKFTIWFVIMIFTFPIMFCDLYYGYFDDTCVNEPAGKLIINLKDYLLVSGWVVMSLLSAISVFLLFIDFNSFSDNHSGGGILCCGMFGVILIALIGIFLIIWNIFGAVIFWSQMDTSECSKNIYNYVFASIIIKLVFNGLGLLSSKNKKEK